MPITGIEKLYAAQQLTDTSAGMTFTKPQYYKDVQKLGIKPKVNTEAAYAENRLIDQMSLFDSADIEADRYSMTSSERAFILGETLTADGGIVASLGDEPPYIAFLYKAPIRLNNAKAYRYGVIYKILFTPPDEEMKGLEGKPDLKQIDKISGKAQPTEWSFKDANGNEKHPWEYHIDTTENLDSTWFSSVPVPSIDAIAALKLSTSVPANNATGVVLDAKPVLTFNNGIADYSNVLLLNVTDNVIVANTKALDTTGKILTITPSANLITGKVHNIVLAGVKDIYGKTLDTQIIKFTSV